MDLWKAVFPLQPQWFSGSTWVSVRVEKSDPRPSESESPDFLGSDYHHLIYPPGRFDLGSPSLSLSDVFAGLVVPGQPQEGQKAGAKAELGVTTSEHRAAGRGLAEVAV